MILLCESYGEENTTGDVIASEVIRLVADFPPEVVVAPINRRYYRLDLPRWLLEEPNRNELDVSTVKSPTDFRLYLQRREERRRGCEQWFSTPLLSPDDLSLLKDENFQEQDLGTLDRLLRAAYEHRNHQQVRLDRRALIAHHWFKRHYEEPEMSTVLAIMAIILLYEASQSPLDQRIPVDRESWKRASIELAHNLGQRALRSLHVEVLVSRWLCETEYKSALRSDRLWSRLQSLQHSLLPVLQKKQIAGIRQFHRMLQLEPPEETEELRTIAEALIAAIGERVDLEQLLLVSEYTRELIRLYLTLPILSGRSEPQLDLHGSHIGQLSAILKRLRVNGKDLILLDPFPYR